MVSEITTDKFRSKNVTQMWKHDPDAATAEIVTPDGGTTLRVMDLENIGSFSAGVMSDVLTGDGVTKLELVAADTAAFDGTVVVIKDSGVVAADAVGDWVFQEMLAEEVAQASSEAGVELKWGAARVTVEDAADECAVVYIGSLVRFAYEDLTPNETIA